MARSSARHPAAPRTQCRCVLRRACRFSPARPFLALHDAPAARARGELPAGDHRRGPLGDRGHRVLPARRHRAHCLQHARSLAGGAARRAVGRLGADGADVSCSRCVRQHAERRLRMAHASGGAQRRGLRRHLRGHCSRARRRMEGAGMARSAYAGHGALARAAHRLRRDVEPERSVHRQPRPYRRSGGRRHNCIDVETRIPLLGSGRARDSRRVRRRIGHLHCRRRLARSYGPVRADDPRRAHGLHETSPQGGPMPRRTGWSGRRPATASLGGPGYLASDAGRGHVRAGLVRIAQNVKPAALPRTGFVTSETG